VTREGDARGARESARSRGESVTVACKILKRLAAVAAVASAIALRPALAQNPPPPPATAPAPAPAVLGNTVPALLSVLNNNDASPSDRDEAAKRLIVIGTPEAIDAMQKVLVNTGNPRGQLAVARALADGPPPDPIYVDPLRAIIGNDPASSEAAARALVNMRGDARAQLQLLDAARDEGRRLSQAARVAVIHALAPLGNKPTAEFLVNLVASDTEPAALRAAAAEELAEMTGDSTRGRDPQLWKQWWANHADKSNEQFEREMLEIRAARLDRIEPKMDRLLVEMRNAYREHFQDAPAGAKEEILLGYLRSPEAEVRAVGAGIVVNLFTESKPIPPNAQRYLRSMVGDSDEQVRLQVAAALREINDRGAVDNVMAQLQVERVPAVRAALAQALAPMGDVRAVQPLLALLKEENPAVVQSAAQALEALRSRLQEKDSKLAVEISQALDDTLQRTVAPGNSAVRDAIVSAMVAWATPQSGKLLFPTFVELVKPNQPASMRRHALAYFGQMGSSETWPAENIIRSGALEDPDASIRLAAVEALGLTAKAQNAQQLYEKLDPNNEKDERVRTAAWNGLAALFPREIDAAQLNAWADKFPDQPLRRLTVLKVLQKKLIEANANKDDLAVVRQNIGATLMTLKDYAGAATAFKMALDTGGQQNQVKEFLSTQLLDAYLLGKDYANATQFGAEMIAQAQQNQSRVGPAILNEARALTEAGAAEDALRLIELALKMDPPLADNYARQLRELEARVRAKAQPASPAAQPATP
jgi:HEAT repeat protein